MNHGSVHALEKNVLGFFESIVMAVAGTAPAYSIAATTATLYGAVGFAGPAALLYSGIPMFGIAWAFNHLGRTEANAGASYAWVAKALHPVFGYLAGWALVVSASLFMLAGSLPAGAVTLAVFNPALANSTLAVTIVGALWFVAMGIVVVRGIRLTSTVQWVMSSVEVGILLLAAVLAIIHAAHHATTPFSWHWYAFSSFHGINGFAAGALVAAFYYWGWDVSANLNEETQNATKIPGLGGLWGVLIVFLLFQIFTVATNVSLPPKTISSSPDVLTVLGQQIWPGVGGELLTLAVMLSTIATLETSLLQVTRSLFAMGRDQTLPKKFGEIHPVWKTPWLASLVVGLFALTLFVLSNFVGSVSKVMSDAINAIGLQITLYYGLAGLSAVVAYRHVLGRSLKNFLLMGLWPFIGALFMFWVMMQSLQSLGWTTIGVGLGTMVLGLIPLAVYWAKGSPYFRIRGFQPAPDEPDLLKASS